MTTLGPSGPFSMSSSGLAFLADGGRLLGVFASSSSLGRFKGRVLARDFSGEPLDPFVEEDLQHAVVLQVEESMTAPGVGVGESH